MFQKANNNTETNVIVINKHLQKAHHETLSNLILLFFFLFFQFHIKHSKIYILIKLLNFNAAFANQ